METQDLRKLSEESRAFLKNGIGQNVDFKQTPDAISMIDLVAFANSEVGGWAFG